MMMERRLEDGGAPPMYLNWDIEFVYALDEGGFSRVVLQSLLDWMSKEEEEDWQDLIIPSGWS